MKRKPLEDVNQIRTRLLNLPPLDVEEVRRRSKEVAIKVRERMEVAVIPQVAVVPPKVEIPTEIIKKRVTPEDVAEAVLDIRDSMKLQEAEGEANAATLLCTTEIQEYEFRHPVTNELTPMFTLNLDNVGSITACIRVNYPSSRTIVLRKLKKIELDWTKAKRKIHRVFYYTENGITTVEAVGKF